MHCRFPPFRVVFLAILVACIITALTALPAMAQESEESLAGELRAALARGGAAEAQRRFDEIWPAEKDRYPYNADEFSLLIQDQLQGASMETMITLTQINQRVMIDGLDPAMLDMFETLMTDAVSVQEEWNAAAKHEVQQEVAAAHPGPARGDLERFTGMYGETGRQMFVNVTCDGYLAVGPMWADIAPWRMRSATDTVFTYSDNIMALTLEFATDADGQATGLGHDMDGVVSPMARNGDLPPEYRTCLPVQVR